jgi:hypothetical protein
LISPHLSAIFNARRRTAWIYWIILGLVPLSVSALYSACI